MANTSESNSVKALAYPLFFLALYTLIIKFLNPILYFIVEGRAQGLTQAPILWDFWWVAHLFLGFCLLRKEKFAWGFALIVSWVEILIILTKFWIFWKNPFFTFWTLSWYVNKCFVLSYFVCLAVCLWLPDIRRELKGASHGA